MTAPSHCRHCGDLLPVGCPADVTSCRGYADWRTRQIGATLSAADATWLALLEAKCAMDVSIRDGLEELPDLPP